MPISNLMRDINSTAIICSYRFKLEMLTFFVKSNFMDDQTIDLGSLKSTAHSSGYSVASYASLMRLFKSESWSAKLFSSNSKFMNGVVRITLCWAKKIQGFQIITFSTFYTWTIILVMSKIVNNFSPNFRIVVTTVVTAGRMHTAGCPPDHFTHIFIDEAGHAMEPEALVAVAGLLYDAFVAFSSIQPIPSYKPRITNFPLSLALLVLFKVSVFLPGADVISRFHRSVNNHRSCNFLSKCFILVLCSYSTQKLFYDINSKN